MSTDLEALVGHLFVVDGRPLRTPSPGSVARPAPRRAARGRDDDTFFGMLSISAEDRQPAAFYEGLIEEISEAYFNTAGSVTSALREAVTRLNESLSVSNRSRERSLSVGFACAVLRQDELYIAVAGLARCFMIQSDTVSRLPNDEDLQEGVLALGTYPEPDVRFFRYDVEPGDFLILADGSLNRLTDTTLRHAVSTGDVDTTLNNLVTVVGGFATADVIKLVEPTQDKGVEAEVTEPERRPLFGGFGGGQKAEKSSRAAQVGSGVLLGMARATEGARKVAEKVLPEEETDNPLDTKLNMSPVAQVAVVVAVAILVALLTTLVYRLRGETSQYDQLVREAQSEITLAREAGGEQGVARPHWENAVYLLEQANALRSPSPEIISLREEALSALDNYDSVTRVSPMMLREYPRGSALKGPIVQGVDVYLLDETEDILYRERLDESGTRLADREPEIITRKGELINEQVVSGLIDLYWMEEGGVPRRNVLAVLSRNGVLITYSPSFDVETTILPGFEAWQDPRAIAIYDRDLYILDAGADEIWRYEATGDDYASAPQRYFTDSTPDLSNAIDLQIDTNGNVYVLRSSGEIDKYFLGRSETFTYTGLPQPVSRAEALYINLGLSERAFFIADAGGGRLYTVAPTGAFLRNYRDDSNRLFFAISGVYTVDRPPYVYVTAGNGLYYFSRAQ